ncbi:MAG: Clp protease N-terminal domain-containing protein [Acidobacteriaceae bacterium]
MFERYTEKARRVVFYARYETSEFGYEYIETDFLLLASARESPELTMRWLGMNYQQLRDALEPMYKRNKRIATSVDLPLSNESKKVLAYAGEEADRLGHRDIGSEHLFLGLVREGGTSARMLKDWGETLDSLRAAIVESPREAQGSGGGGGGARGSTRPAVLKVRIEAESGESVGEVWWQGHMPRIGEAIRVPDLDGNQSTYRILDFCWHMNGPKGFAVQPIDALLKVKKEQV